LKRFLGSGWSVGDVDDWLAGMPAGIGNFWIRERLRFNVQHRRGENLVMEMSESVRENPEDVTGAIAYLDALIYARYTGRETWDRSWMEETVKPQFAGEAEKLASRLGKLGEWLGAAAFYRLAVETPLTEKEVRDLGMMCSVFVAPVALKAMFAAHTREGFSACLLELGRKDSAQILMLEGADIRKKHNLGFNALFAGEVQGKSGQRDIERRIAQEEGEAGDDPEYWRKRAEYYRGRNETKQEEEALLRGLKQTLSYSTQRNSGTDNLRSWLIGDYARFLQRNKRTEDAVALLREEIESSKPGSPSACLAARTLAFDFPKKIGVGDTVLWDWLEHRPKWEHTETRLLWRLLESARPDELNTHFRYAEDLARSGHASRSCALGWIMNRMSFPKRSIPVLQHGISIADTNELESRMRFTLFESYLDLDDWQNAEQLFPLAAQRLTPGEQPEWYSRIAVAATKTGDLSDAMRIWRRVANLNPACIESLENLAAAGLRTELLELYRELSVLLPASDVPPRAIRILIGN